MSLAKFYNLCDLQQWTFTSDQLTNFTQASWGILGHYSWLAEDAKEKQQLQYAIVQNFHLFARYAEQAEFLTPRLVSSNGAVMRAVKCIAATCRSGSNTNHMADDSEQVFVFALT